ncbi:hypothetical protein M422DRAFT_247031 [Sphaerobolus stellatus SS14]|nr:hypothetical protein M422DRAFT_247031 [Sphaerobolus stellatus SS14]
MNSRTKPPSKTTSVNDSGKRYPTRGNIRASTDKNADDAAAAQIEEEATGVAKKLNDAQVPYDPPAQALPKPQEIQSNENSSNLNGHTEVGAADPREMADVRTRTPPPISATIQNEKSIGKHPVTITIEDAPGPASRPAERYEDIFEVFIFKSHSSDELQYYIKTLTSLQSLAENYTPLKGRTGHIWRPHEKLPNEIVRVGKGMKLLQMDPQAPPSRMQLEPGRIPVKPVNNMLNLFTGRFTWETHENLELSSGNTSTKKIPGSYEDNFQVPQHLKAQNEDALRPKASDQACQQVDAPPQAPIPQNPLPATLPTMTRILPAAEHVLLGGYLRVLLGADEIEPKASTFKENLVRFRAYESMEKELNRRGWAVKKRVDTWKIPADDPIYPNVLITKPEFAKIFELGHSTVREDQKACRLALSVPDLWEDGDASSDQLLSKYEDYNLAAIVKVAEKKKAAQKEKERDEEAGTKVKGSRKKTEKVVKTKNEQKKKRKKVESTDDSSSDEESSDSSGSSESEPPAKKRRIKKNKEGRKEKERRERERSGKDMGRSDRKGESKKAKGKGKVVIADPSSSDNTTDDEVKRRQEQKKEKVRRKRSSSLDTEEFLNDDEERNN